GAQWIDELSIHFYPYFSWTVCSWTGSACGPAGFHRNSDYAVSAMTQQIANFRAIETTVGTPHKPIMMTESNIPRWSYVSAANLETFPNNKTWGSDATQKNYTIKAFAKMMAAGLDMFYLYQTGETGDSGLNNGTAGSEIDAMGMYKNLVKATPGNEVLTSQGIAIKTMQQLMGNYKVDGTQPAFPSGVDGVRFDSAGNKIYVVWAITTQDMSETASGSYTLPAGANFKKYLYDGTSPGEVSGTISLSGDPYILVQTNGVINSLSCNAGTNQTITLPTSTATLDASGSSSGNDSVSSYTWTQISGPNNSNILNDSILSTTANNLVAGSYNYQLKIKTANGDSCVSTVQVNVQSVLAPISNLLPVAVLAGSQIITLPINSIWLIGSGSYEPGGGSIASYSWKQISGPSNVIFITNTPTTFVTGMIAGTYVFQLTITDKAGVSSVATTTVTVNSLSLLQDASKQTDSSTTEKDISALSTATNKMQLYPNPAQGTINLQLNSDTTGTIVIHVFSITGQPVISKQSEKTGNYYQTSFDISRLASGTYMMQILIGGKQQLTAKFLKQ
ncbi:MAG TPA: T9SS type A sorting domain-containing protein, partial [Puia sp.]|nr:T9SS type A sorting domain-containing protein [Puia sp.]